MSLSSKNTSVSKLRHISETDYTSDQPGVEPLARLFRQLLSQCGADTQAEWNMLLHKHVTDMRNAVPQNKKDMATTRGNLQKELLKSEMTFNVFLKGLRFLELNKVDINIVGHRKNGEVFTGSITIGLGERIPVPTTIVKQSHRENPNE